MGPICFRNQHRHWDSISVSYESNLWTILMKTVDGFRKVPSVAFDTTNNGSSNPWKSTRLTRLVAECFDGLSKTFYTVFFYRQSDHRVPVNRLTTRQVHFRLDRRNSSNTDTGGTWQRAACMRRKPATRRGTRTT